MRHLEALATDTFSCTEQRLEKVLVQDNATTRYDPQDSQQSLASKKPWMTRLQDER